MPRAFLLQISGRRLLLGLVCTFVPVSLLALYASTRVGQEAESSAGSRLQAIAESTASAIRDRIRAKVIEAAIAASDTAVLTAVRDSNASYGSANEETVVARLTEQDALWATPSGQQVASRILAHPASDALRRLLVRDPDFLRITVTDRHGATVAATHKTLDYYQGDEEYWQDIFATGRGAVSLTDVLYDDASQHQYIGVGVPVVDENNVLIGTLDGLVGIASLFPLVSRTDLGSGGRMAVVRSDGFIITSLGGLTLSSREQSLDYGAVVDAAERLSGIGSGFLTADFADGRGRIVAFARTGLDREFRNLNWSVVVSQDSSEALGASWTSQALIMLIALLTLGSVVLVAVYVSMHRQSEIEEIEELRHSGLVADAPPDERAAGDSSG